MPTTTQDGQEEFFGDLGVRATVKAYFILTGCQQQGLHGGVVEYENLLERSKEFS